ncbi:MAG: glycoside hydrolase family 30 beta sandwich domain-containing protein [Gammaproteobacteria bacterium]
MVLSILVSGCSRDNNDDAAMRAFTDINNQLTNSTEVLLTSEGGDKIANKENVSFREGHAHGNMVIIRPDIVKQTIDGIGTSFTESSAFVLAHLDKDKRLEVMDKIYGEQGANFTLARTPIGATDFSVEGHYSYDDVDGDDKLEHFSLAPDKDGFQVKDYPGIRDSSYDLLPMIKEANAIKSRQKDADMTIIASAWTAPAWMKDIEAWHIPGAPDNDWQGTGGELKKEYIPVYADYITRYLDAYKREGVDIWGLTPVNEPEGNNGQWESMHFTPESQNDFVKNHLGPKLQASNNGDVKLLVYDQNRDRMELWTDVIFADTETAKYVHGVAVHWYASTFKVYEETFDRVHDRFPEFSIIHTEGTIDDLGKPAPGGILDPVRFKESDWFDNDAFWWNANATDWAYTATWPGVIAEDHPVYTPVHRYARNIIVSLNHWLSGWIDWNIVLDQDGGPNHVGNFCGAPIMIDVATRKVYYTPVYYVLAQFSRTIRPGDKAVQAYKYLDGLEDDALHASATINSDSLLSVQLLNTTKKPVSYMLQIGKQYAQVDIDANALQTVRVQL